MVKFLDRLGFRKKTNFAPVTPYKPLKKDEPYTTPYAPPPPRAPAPKPPTIQELPPSQMNLSSYVNVEQQPPYINSHFDPYAPGSAPRPTAYSPPPKKPSQPTPPGNLPLYRAPGQRVTPEELRELREQIRQRYQLDVQVWGMRYLRERDRDIVQEKIKRADALLDKIRRTVISWDKQEFWDPHTRDYEKFREIKRRVCSPGKRDWTNHPPWEEQSVGSRLF